MFLLINQIGRKTMKYSEDKLFSKNYKAEYKEGIERLIEYREKAAALIRENN